MPPSGTEMRMISAHTQRGRNRTLSERKTSTRQKTSKVNATIAIGASATVAEPKTVKSIYAIITNNDTTMPTGRQAQ